MIYMLFIKLLIRKIIKKLIKLYEIIKYFLNHIIITYCNYLIIVIIILFQFNINIQ